MKTDSLNLSKTDGFSVRMNPLIKSEFANLADKKGISKSQLFMEMLLREFKENDIKIKVPEIIL